MTVFRLLQLKMNGSFFVVLEVSFAMLHHAQFIGSLESMDRNRLDSQQQLADFRVAAISLVLNIFILCNFVVAGFDS